MGVGAPCVRKTLVAEPVEVSEVVLAVLAARTGAPEVTVTTELRGPLRPRPGGRLTETESRSLRSAVHGVGRGVQGGSSPEPTREETCGATGSGPSTVTTPQS